MSNMNEQVQFKSKLIREIVNVIDSSDFESFTDIGEIIKDMDVIRMTEKAYKKYKGFFEPTED